MVQHNRTYSLLNLQAKFFKVLSFGQITANHANLAQFAPNIPHHLLIHYVSDTCPGKGILPNSSELCKFRAFRPHSLRITRNLHQLLTDYMLCFRHLPQQRTLRNSSELCKFHAVHPHSPRIMRNSHQLLIYYILCFRCRPVAENSLKFQRIK